MWCTCPAHIYVRVGQYDKAIASNIRSQRVDKEFVELWGDHPFPNIGTYPLSHRIHIPHAIDFIRYAATIQGNYYSSYRGSAGIRELAHW